MEYLKIEGEFPKLANCAVTMGKFDGIHRGHRKLVEKIRERKTLGEQAVLFAIDASSNMILTSQERASLLEKLGVDVLVECQLNDRIRHMKAENFIKEILMGDLCNFLPDLFIPKDPLYQQFTTSKGDLTFLYFHYPSAFPCR